MKYVKFEKDGERGEGEVALSPRDEALASAFINHEQGLYFGYENMGMDIVLTFWTVEREEHESKNEAVETVGPAVIQVFNVEIDPLIAWPSVVAEAADYLNIHVGEFA